MYSIKFEQKNYKELKTAFKFLGLKIFKRNGNYFYKESNSKFSVPLSEGQEIKKCFDNPFNRHLFEIHMQEQNLEYDLKK